MTVFGYDISHHQGPFDHDIARSEGMRFAYMKCTEGANFKDDRWPQNRDRALAAGTRVAAYHFLRSDHDVEAQADNILDHIGNRKCPIVIDCEKRVDPSEGISSHPSLKHVKQFKEACRSRGMYVSLLYLPRWYWQERGQPGIGRLPPVINSAYGSEPLGGPEQVYPGDNADAWIPYGGQTPVMWQFSRKAMVAGQRIDVNAYRGPESDLDRWFLTPPPPPEEEGSGMELDTIINAKAVEEDGAKPYYVRRALLDVRDTKAKLSEVSADMAAHEGRLVQIENAMETRFTETKTAMREFEARVVAEIRAVDTTADVDAQAIAAAVVTAFWSALAPEPSEPAKLPRRITEHDVAKVGSPK